jgi:hypothetical protein
METRKISFEINDNLCVCVRERERERERERDVQAFEVLNCIFAPKTSQQKPAHYHHLCCMENRIQNLESQQIIVHLSSTLILQMQPRSE